MGAILQHCIGGKKGIEVIFTVKRTREGTMVQNRPHHNATKRSHNEK